MQVFLDPYSQLNYATNFKKDISTQTELQGQEVIPQMQQQIIELQYKIDESQGEKEEVNKFFRAKDSTKMQQLQYQTLKNRIEKLTQAKLKIQQDNLKQNQDYEKQIKHLQNQVNEYQQEIMKYKLDLKNLEALNSEKTQFKEVKLLKFQLNALQQQHQNCMPLIEVNVIKSSLKQANQVNLTLSSRIKTLENCKNEEEVEKILNRCQILEKQEELIFSVKSNLNPEIIKQKQQIQLLEQRISKWKEKYKILKKEKQMIQFKNQNLENETKESQSLFNQSESQLEKLKKENQKLQQQLANETSKLQKLNSNNIDWEQISVQREQVQNFIQFKKLKEEMKTKERKIVYLQKQIKLLKEQTEENFNGILKQNDTLKYDLTMQLVSLNKNISDKDVEINLLKSMLKASRKELKFQRRKMNKSYSINQPALIYDMTNRMKILDDLQSNKSQLCLTERLHSAIQQQENLFKTQIEDNVLGQDLYQYITQKDKKQKQQYNNDINEYQEYQKTLQKRQVQEQLQDIYRKAIEKLLYQQQKKHSEDVSPIRQKKKSIANRYNQEFSEAVTEKHSYNQKYQQEQISYKTQNSSKLLESLRESYQTQMVPQSINESRKSEKSVQSRKSSSQSKLIKPLRSISISQHSKSKQSQQEEKQDSSQQYSRESFVSYKSKVSKPANISHVTDQKLDSQNQSSKRKNSLFEELKDIKSFDDLDNSIHSSDADKQENYFEPAKMFPTETFSRLGTSQQKSQSRLKSSSSKRQENQIFSREKSSNGLNSQIFSRDKISSSQRNQIFSRDKSSSRQQSLHKSFIKKKGIKNYSSDEIESVNLDNSFHNLNMEEDDISI